MPRARSSQFAEGETSRALPPASDGLRAPAGVSSSVSAAQRRHPGKPGRLTENERDSVVDTTMALMDKLTATEIAAKAGTSRDGRTVRSIIKAARTALQQRAEFYVEAHAAATVVAAAQGDAKPAQWALERIAEGEDRIVDRDKNEGPSAPTFNIGFNMGGVPKQLAPAPVEVLDAETVDAQS
jgi:hypothetical protein